MLGKRDAEHYGTLTLVELEVRIRHWARQLGLETTFFHTNSEGEFVERLHQAPRAGRRPGPQPGRVDALQLRDPGRARDRRHAGGRGAPVRRRSARGVAPRNPSSRTSSMRPRRGQGRRTATARRSSCSPASSASTLRRRRERASPSAQSASPRSSRSGSSTCCWSANLRQRALPDRLHGDQRRRAWSGPGGASFLTDFRYVERAEREVAGLRRRARPRGPARDRRRAGARLGTAATCGSASTTRT